MLRGFIRKRLKNGVINIPFPSIKWKRLDFRPFWIEYRNGYGHWVWYWEIEESKKRWPDDDISGRPLSFLEINFFWWHKKKDLQYRKQHGIKEYQGYMTR